ncbi:MAG: hypothetical protein ACE5GE_15900 [Phycisphaerae bacterium]
MSQARSGRATLDPLTHAVTLFQWILLVVASIAAGAGGVGVAGEPRDQAGPSDEQIQALIRQLGDPAYPTRAEASRRLCMLGQRAAQALQRAARSDEFEVALRAADLLRVIDSVYFGGCSVRLDADRRAIAWDQAFALTATFKNDSPYRAQLPFDTSPPSDQPASAQARQVGNMLDLSEYLRVVGPDGRQVSLRIDDIRVDAEVSDVVEWRSEGGPVDRLGPGQALQVRIEAFNRGWARYPLLAEGIYKIVFDYEPQWDDEEFRRAGVGRVTAAPLEIQVTRPAPDIVRRSRHVAKLELVRIGDELVAQMANTDDLPVWVNRNFQGIQPPFADLRWTVQAGETLEDIKPRPGDAWWSDDFSRQRLNRLEPGQVLEIGRLGLTQVRGRPAVKALPAGSAFKVRVSWGNLCDAAWQRGTEPATVGNPRAPADLRGPLPHRMLTGRFSSDALSLKKP